MKDFYPVGLALVLCAGLLAWEASKESSGVTLVHVVAIFVIVAALRQWTLNR